MILVPILALMVQRAAAQSGVTAGGIAYVCVPVGTCPISPGNGEIDPRIITPEDLCPPGEIPCSTLDTLCGVTSVQIRATDGRAEEGSFPWQAYLRNATGFAGSGVLIDTRRVLTAAHKVELYDPNFPQGLTVHMGVYNPQNIRNSQSRTVSKIITHYSYNNSSLKNDIAILILSNPIQLGQNENINTICLPPASGTGPNPYIGQKCVVSGWGQTNFNTNDAPTQPMKQVFVRIVDYNTCRTSYARSNLLGSRVDYYLDQNGEICAGGDALKDACSQDGGSPLVCETSPRTYTLAGLVIWGKNCGLQGVYGVYVSVPAYRNWIDSNLN